MWCCWRCVGICTISHALFPITHLVRYHMTHLKRVCCFAWHNHFGYQVYIYSQIHYYLVDILHSIWNVLYLYHYCSQSILLPKFYTRSWISIRGEDCSLENIGVLADMTNGAVNIVDPTKVMDEFSSILSQPVIATHVSVKLVMHKGLFVRCVFARNQSLFIYLLP